MSPRYVVASLMVVLGVLAVSPVGGETNDTGDRARESVSQALDTRQTTQKEEDRWRSEKQELLAAYEQLREEEKRLRVLETQLREETAAAAARVAAKEKELTDSEEISGRIQPFLEELVNRLKEKVSSDMPFLVEERTQRIDRLTALLSDPGVTVSEKYRKAMEALLVEAEYGNSIEVYQQTIAVNGASRLVNIFRLGRISLFYQTLDQKECGFYDVAAAGWRPLSGAFNRVLQTAMEIGAKRRPVELLTLPLGRMAKQ
ncbi:MAG: DUF3450 domain-containing protein [Pseudomonadota bacterium]